MSEIKGTQQSKVSGDLVKPEGEISRRELLKRLSPFGKVELDTSRCTGCGLCALECPTGALVFSSSEETDTFQLVFRYDHCVACDQCVEICPEKCLRVERILELKKMDSQSVLFEDTIIRCSGCGSPIGPKTMIDKLQARLATSRQPIPPQFGLCPTCKVQAQFNELRV